MIVTDHGGGWCKGNNESFCWRHPSRHTATYMRHSKTGKKECRLRKNLLRYFEKSSSQKQKKTQGHNHSTSKYYALLQYGDDASKSIRF